MSKKLFLIDWGGNRIIYDPLMGIIKNFESSNITRLKINRGNLFTGYSVISNELFIENYKPFCLTIYVGNKCNLSCKYCYVQEKHYLPQNYIDSAAVIAAAKFVAQNCVDINMPFILGFHGGNEPLLAPQVVNDCIEICRAIAANHSLKFLCYCTTNGVISEKTARWAAKTFTGIRLSWDGPPGIHDKYRLKLNGEPSGANVKSSAKIFLDPENGLKEFIIRATITTDSVNRISEIIEYFFVQGARRVEIYPAFQNSAGTINCDIIPDANDFIKNFIIAKKWAGLHHMTLLFTGSRLFDFHDKHCLIFQNNLTITPDGYLTACFLASQNYKNKNDKYIYGCYDKKSDKLIIDKIKLAGIFERISKQYSQCVDCFNYFHCSKGCPAVCSFQDDLPNLNHFDCTIEKWAGVADIFESAKLNVSVNNLNNINQRLSIKKLSA